MTVRSDLRENRWLRAQLAILVFAVAYMPVAGVLALLTGSSWVLAPVLAYVTAGALCWVRSRRTRIALEAARAAAEREAAVLRTPRAPDAGPDQCPVCGGYGLDALAKDDAFMERGALAKVVPWGSRRAHWDCAEFSPYVEPKQHFEPFDTDGHMTYCACPRCSKGDGNHRAYSRCTFCGFYQFGPSRDAAKAKLIAHVKECSKRPRPTMREIEAAIDDVGERMADLDARIAAAASHVSFAEALHRLGKGY